MVKIGLLGLDTSHAEAYADVLTEHESATLSAVWDGGDVREKTYVREFCETYDATRYDEPHAMADGVDAVMILTVDWDTHRDLSTPFLEAGVPTMIDKPIAGCLDDVRAIRSAADGTPFFGGSAVPYHSAVESLSAEFTGQSLYCVGYNDPFYYGVHLVDSVRRLVDADWTCVLPADDPGAAVDVVFTDGTYATLRLDGGNGEDGFAFLSVDERTTSANVGNGSDDFTDMYRSYIDRYLDVIAGDADVSARVLDAAGLLLGVRAALETDRPVTPECDAIEEFHADGRAFLEDYRPYY